MKKRKVYWLSEHVTTLHKERGLQLSEKGYDVYFFSTFQDLVQAIATKRTGIIVLSDDGPENVVEDAINKIAHLPEIQGARLILTVSKKSPKILALAASSGFRDLIPLDIDFNSFINRFIFSTAGKGAYLPQPSGVIGINQVCSLSLPARISWISQSRLWIECRICPPRGTTLKLTGPMATDMGANSLLFTVEETKNTNLIYRFSDALIGSWRIAQSAKDSAQSLLEQLREADTGPRCKVFIAVQNVKLRSEIISRFDQNRFEVNTALQKQSIIDEPRFFGPQIVIVEDLLCTGEEVHYFHKMLGNLAMDVPVIIIGMNVKREIVQRLDPTRKFYMFSRLPDKLADNILTKYLPQISKQAGYADKDSIHINHDNAYSVAEISFSARLKLAHPSCVQIAVPFLLGNYGLCRLDAPLLTKALGRSPYVKLIEVYEDLRTGENAFPWLADCLLANVDKQSQRQIAQTLTQYITDNFNQLLDHKLSVPPPSPEQKTKDRGPVVQLVTTTQHKALSEQQPQGAVAQLRSHIVETDRIQPKESLADLLTDMFVSMYDAGIEIFSNKNFRYALYFISFSAFIGALLWSIVTYVAPSWQKSGNQYNDSLKKFAPEKFQQ